MAFIVLDLHPYVHMTLELLLMHMGHCPENKIEHGDMLAEVGCFKYGTA